jgi:tetratricopeptide (TPR) repeat protein
MKHLLGTQNEQYSCYLRQGGTIMIQQWFATMNDMLDDLILRYPHASGEEKNRLQQQWDVLKTLSDDIIELWLQFEDKMSLYRDLQQQQIQHTPEPQKLLVPFVKGQGYFKLHMFEQASQQLEEAIALNPDFTSARLFLAMSRMHMKEWTEAQRHFQLIAAIADENRVQAIAYNALGCIQAIYAHLEQAQHYFKKALEADPTFGDPKLNMESCKQGKGQLQLQFGSAELQSLVQV